MWLDKRDVSAYFLLEERFKGRRFNVGEAIEVLAPYFGRKVSISLIKRLSRVGLLTKVSTNEYVLNDLMEWLEERSHEYLVGRLRRRQGGTSGFPSSPSSS